MIKRDFYTPEEVRPLYGQIVPAYQEAFAGDPWREVSKCVDEKQKCSGGFSPVAIGELCMTCGNCPDRPAYEAQEVVKKFDTLAASRPTSWYVEQNERGVTLAAVAWSATPKAVALEKYVDAPEMTPWLMDTLGKDEITWLDEVFANKKLKANGNLSNFGEMILGFAARLDRPLVAYRTITPQMTEKPLKVFGSLTTVFPRKTDVPDRRDFVIIDLREEI